MPSNTPLHFNTIHAFFNDILQKRAQSFTSLHRLAYTMAWKSTHFVQQCRSAGFTARHPVNSLSPYDSRRVHTLTRPRNPPHPATINLLHADALHHVAHFSCQFPHLIWLCTHSKVTLVGCLLIVLKPSLRWRHSEATRNNGNGSAARACSDCDFSAQLEECQAWVRENESIRCCLDRFQL